MFGFPSWIVLAVVGAVAAGLAGTATYKITSAIYDGEIAAINLRHTTALAKQADEANAILLASKDAALEQEKKAQAAFNKLEGDYNAALDHNHGMAIANGRLVAAAGGLYDKNGRAACRPSGGDNVPDAAGRPAGAESPAAGCKLSDETTKFLLDLAADADDTAILANLGIGLNAKLKELVH